MRRALLICLILIGLGVGPVRSQKAEPDAQAEASARLEIARWYLEGKDYANAQKLILEALTAAPGNEPIKQQAKSLWQAVEQAKSASQVAAAAATKAAENKKAEEAEAKIVTDKDKQEFQLDDAERLSAQGKNDKAHDIASSVLNTATDKQVIDRANAILAKNQPSPKGLLGALPQRVFIIAGWVMDVVIGILLVFGLYYLLRFARFVRALWKRYSWQQARKIWRALKASPPPVPDFTARVKTWIDRRKEYHCWVLSEIADAGKTGGAEMIADAFNRVGEKRAPEYSALLQLDNLQLPVVPFALPEVQIDLVPALEAVNLEVGGIKLGGIAKALSGLKNWFDARLLWIKGTVVIQDSKVIVRLTRRNANDTTDTITATADKSKITDAAEAATYMMYYVIAKEATVPQAADANELRDGLKLLGQYISAGDPKQLTAAYEAFRNVRNERPSFNEAYLYEGIALDLLERHEEAVRRFQYLERTTTDPQLLQKAQYNQAVSLFRAYTVSGMNEAIAILDKLIGVLPPTWYWDSPNDILQLGLTALQESPIKALALATKANIIAHKPIFWREYCDVPKAADEDALLQHKAAARITVRRWIYEVNAITGHLRTVLRQAQGDAWADSTKQQLKWAIENALGNTYLNCANSYYIAPNLPNVPEAEIRKRYLNQAYTYLQRCEVILPPGVETLTNLATTLLELHREDEARAYLLRSKAISPNYEYADFRLAESWERTGRVDKLILVLREFAAKDKTPTIAGFQQLYSKYALELARYAPEPAAASVVSVPTPGAQANP